MIMESVETKSTYSTKPQLIIPQVVYDFHNKEKIRAITYTIHGIKYQFSNEDGHKVYQVGSYSSPRPMSKKEFKDICKIMIDNSSSYGEMEETILSEIEKLNFSIGHANSTFEIVRSCVEQSKLGTLVMNIGPARYFYHPTENRVFHVDHSKLINGHMLTPPESNAIISKMTASKTMTKKIQKILNN